MDAVDAGTALIACCGLYCGACRSYKKGRCPGCDGNEKATWCGVRSCCREHAWSSCAHCDLHQDPQACAHFNSFVARVFGVIFNSNRRACILKLRQLGPAEYADYMAARGLQSLPRRPR